MPFTETSGLRYFTFSAFDRTGVKHAIFTRRGGVSPAPWHTLNTGGLSGDERANIIENRQRIFKALNQPIETIFDVWQVHSSTVVTADRPRPLDAPHQKADAIITNKPGLTLFMRFGDCVPILLFDPDRRVIGIAHAGWLGTVKHIAQKTAKAMQEIYKCNPKNILAGIGPSIGPDHYQVGEDVTKKVEAAFSSAPEILERKDGKTIFDLWTANAASLQMAGVDQIEQAEICTACHTEDWFSHRAESGKTGRFSALICLDE